MFFRKRAVLFVIMAVFIFLFLGCASTGKLLPTSRSYTDSQWKTFKDFHDDWSGIRPGDSVERVGEQNVIPGKTKNCTMIDEPAIREYFNRQRSLDVLPKEIADPLENGYTIVAIKITLDNIVGKREGDVFRDLLGIKRIKHTTGWKVNALIIFKTRDKTSNINLPGAEVVYKTGVLSPNIDRYEIKEKPLGPLQDLNFNLDLKDLVDIPTATF